MRIYALLEQQLSLKQTMLYWQQKLAEAVPNRETKLEVDTPRYHPVPGGPIVKAYMMYIQSNEPHAEDGYIKCMYFAELTNGAIHVKDGHCSLSASQFDSEADFLAYLIKELKLKKKLK